MKIGKILHFDLDGTFKLSTWSIGIGYFALLFTLWSNHPLILVFLIPLGILAFLAGVLLWVICVWRDAKVKHLI
ncbi:MAG: hypothetical protein IIA61_02040 [Candidatus Marinimicrobia bacterium]|nr:hypothetical protein [Candidatus Neomarinimicrobiota bacterium]